MTNPLLCGNTATPVDAFGVRADTETLDDGINADTPAATAGAFAPIDTSLLGTITLVPRDTVGGDADRPTSTDGMPNATPVEMDGACGAMFVFAVGT
jgi:hypothetical protein